MRKTMNLNTTKVAMSTLVAAMAFGACASASAQTAGTWSVSVGINDISPQGTTDAFSAPSIVNSTTKVHSDAQPVVEISYNFTDHISAEFGLGTPYKHELDGAGSLSGSGKLGTLKQLPPTLFAQYHFMDANAQFRPYVGLGLTYAIFRDETGNGTLTAITNTGGQPTTFKVDNAWGVTPQVGATYAFNSKWYADAMIGKTYISTTVHLSPGETASAPLNPLVGSLTIGYRF
jgi:outer membrane protein